LQFTGPGRSEPGMQLLPRGLADEANQIQHACFGASADVPCARLTGVGGGEEGVHDIADVHVIASLATVSVNYGPLATHDPAAEDRHHTGLTGRVLSRPVHVP